MATLYTPRLTLPESTLPTVELPIFSDADAQTPHIKRMGQGAEDLANATLGLGAEAAVLSGKTPSSICQAITAGNLCVGIAFYGQDPLAGMAITEQKAGIYAVPMAEIDLEGADGHTLLTIDGDVLQVSSRSRNVSASATFNRHGTGIYTPGQLSYAERYAGGPYAENSQAITLRGLASYTQLLRHESRKPAALRKRLHALMLLGNGARHYTNLVQNVPMHAAIHVAVEGKNL